MSNKTSMKTVVENIHRATEAQGVGGVIVILVRSDGQVGTVCSAFPEQQAQVGAIDDLVRRAFPPKAAEGQIFIPAQSAVMSILRRGKN